MRIGMVCPYSFDVHGGVQSHVLQLAEVMRERGHDVSVLAPSSRHVSDCRQCEAASRSDARRKMASRTKRRLVAKATGERGTNAVSAPP